MKIWNIIYKFRQIYKNRNFITLLQTGYLSTVDSVFVASSVVAGKVIILQGSFENNKPVFRVKKPSYATSLRNIGNFDFTANDCVLGSYKDNQLFPADMPSHKKSPYNFEEEESLKLAVDWGLATCYGIEKAGTVS